MKKMSPQISARGTLLELESQLILIMLGSSLLSSSYYTLQILERMFSSSDEGELFLGSEDSELMKMS